MSPSSGRSQALSSKNGPSAPQSDEFWRSRLKREHAPTAYASSREESTDIGFRTAGVTNRGIRQAHDYIDRSGRKTKRSELNSLISLKLDHLEDALMTERQQRESVEAELNQLRRKVKLRTTDCDHQRLPPGITLPILTKKRNGDFASHGLTRRVPTRSRIKEPQTRQVGQARSLPRLDHKTFFSGFLVTS
jgi:hypothetical protein